MEIGKTTLSGLRLVLLQVAFEFISSRRSPAVRCREIINLENSVVCRGSRLTMRHRYDKEFGLKFFHCLTLAKERWNHIVGSGIARRKQLSALMLT